MISSRQTNGSTTDYQGVDIIAGIVRCETAIRNPREVPPKVLSGGGCQHYVDGTLGIGAYEAAFNRTGSQTPR